MEVQTTAPATTAPTEAAPVTPAVAETPAPEAAAPAPEAPKVEETKEDPKFAARFAALTRREQALRAKETEVKDWQSKHKAFEEEQKLMDANPLEYLQKKGWTFDKLTQLALNDGKKPAEMRVQELEERLEKEKREREEKETKAAQTRYENQKKEFVGNIGKFLKDNAEAYEFCAAEDDGAQLIYDTIEEHYVRTKEQSGTGRVMTIEEAAKAVEKYFEDLVDNKYSKINKLKSKFQPKEAALGAGTAPQAPASPKPATLTNTQASSVATPSDKKALSVEESKREAARLLRWV